jgi:aminoglycoside phosphotransferase (APT) family kinase protein
MNRGDIDLSALDPAHLPLIGRGVSAEVFALADGRALKLLLPGVPESTAAREFAATRVAHAARLPVPRPFGEVTVGDRHGLVIARLEESRWLRRMRRWPGAVMVTLAEMARQHAALHQVAVPAGALPSTHEVLETRIAGSLAGPRAIAAARAALAQLPRADRLGHGDLHLGNFMTTGGGLMLIDWAQAMAGDPAADIARSELVMRFGRYGALLRRHALPRITREAAAAWYLLCYRRQTGMSDAAIDAWRLPVAVAWLREGSAAHLPALQAYVDRRLARRPAAARRGRHAAA